MKLKVIQFASDGEILCSAELGLYQLSTKWLSVCEALFEGGPVFSQSMGSTLAHYEIDFAAGMCEFKVRGILAFSGVVLLGTHPSQDLNLVNVFERRLGMLAPCGSADGVPTFVILNMLDDRVTDQDQSAMFQLAYHVAAAYCVWSAA